MGWDSDNPKGLPTLREILSRGHQSIVLIAVVLSVVCLSVILLVVTRSYTQRNLVLIGETLNYTLEPAIVFNDREAMRQGIESVVGNGNARQIDVLDPAGRTIFTWVDDAESAAPVWELALDGILTPEPLARPIQRDGVRIATLHIQPGSRAIAGYVASGLFIAICSIIITLLATRILARRLQEAITEPLQRIARVAHLVREERSLGERVEPSGIAEIDGFARDFNALLEELEGWHTSLVDQNKVLAFQALHDPLTGLGNRVQFENEFHDMLQRALRSSSSFALLYIDLDKFKPINDSFGHMVGDAALIEVARRLSQTIRKTDRAFRLGGDEFAVLLDFGLVRAHVETVVNKLEAALARPIEIDESITLIIRQSMGWAVFPDHGAAMEDLIRRADDEMYVRKRKHAVS